MGRRQRRDTIMHATRHNINEDINTKRFEISSEKPHSAVAKRGNGKSTLNIKEVHHERFYAVTKRLMDISMAIFIILLTLPVIILIVCAIKLDSPGPVLFKQKRIGRNRRKGNRPNRHIMEQRNGQNLKGQPIEIYKFRTMWVDVEPYAVCPNNNGDPRVTRVGKILRKLCLDELPQLINVVKGDLSIVGPRPEMPFIVERYGGIETLRLLVKPGMTGLWQLYGSREQFIHENLQYDLDYIRNRSLKLDLKILIKTVFFVLTFHNV
ncbi:MAG: sugar transferase [bacterium]